MTSDPDGTYTADNTTISLTAAIQDAYGNTVTTGDDATASVNLALSGWQHDGTFLRHPSPKTRRRGVVTFGDLQVRKVGTNYKLTATSGSLTAGDSTLFNITPGAPKSLKVATGPAATYNADQTFNVTVEAYDLYLNLVTDQPVLVALGLSGGSSPSGYSNPAAANTSNGTATFSNVAVRKVGTNYKLTATSGSLTAGDSTLFNITPGAPKSLKVATGPAATYNADQTFNVTVEAYDLYLNLVTDQPVLVALGLSGGSSPSGYSNPAAANTSNGTATFSNVAVRKVGTNYKLTATSGSLTAGDSTLFNITPGAPKSLKVATGPAATYNADQTFNVTVEAYDLYLNLVTDQPVLVALGLSGGSVRAATATPLPRTPATAPPPSRTSPSARSARTTS